jgi:hypothetical protein
MIYINKEIAEVSFDRIVLNACGTKEAVVKKAATKPVISIQFIV